MSSLTLTGAEARQAARRDMCHQLEPGEDLDFINEYDVLEEWLNGHIASGEAPDRLILRTRHELYIDNLVARLARHFRPTDRWHEFVDAVLNCREMWFADLLDPATLGLIFNRVETLEYIAKHHLDLIRERHPWAKALRWDTFWASRIRRFIRSGSFRRAYRELGRARHGLYVGDTSLTEQQHCCIDDLVCNPAERAFPADKKLLANLIEELYATMAQAELVPLKPVLGWKWQANPRRGVHLAELFRPSHQMSGGTITYEPPGGMALTLGQHFLNLEKQKHSRSI